jgi:hypothetical protein
LQPAEKYLNPNIYKQKMPQEQNAALRHLHLMLHKGAYPYSILSSYLKNLQIVLLLQLLLPRKKQGVKEVYGREYRGKPIERGFVKLPLTRGPKPFARVAALRDQ